jgi:hypothetical protein
VTHYLIEREVLLEGAEHRIRGKMRGNTALLCGVIYNFLQRTRFATASEFDRGSFSALFLERVSFVVQEGQQGYGAIPTVLGDDGRHFVCWTTGCLCNNVC